MRGVFRKRKDQELLAFRRLLIVAGPPACGKSSFLSATEEYLTDSSVPADIRADLLSGRRLGVSALPEYVGPPDPCVCLHMDLMQPFHGQGLYTSKDLRSAFSPGAFQEWGLLECMRRAEEISFLTLCLGRKELFRRWFDRSIASGHTRLSARMVALYGDESEDAATLRALYTAWADYISGFPVRLHCGLGVSQKRYLYHSCFDPSLIDGGE